MCKKLAYSRTSKMFNYKKKIYHSLLLGSGLILNDISNSYAYQTTMPVTMATGVSLSVTYTPNPSYLLALAINLQTSEYAMKNQGLITYYLSLAAKQGSAEAQFQLGNIYLNGELLEQNEEKALYWLSKAAAQDHAPAQFVMEQAMEDGFDIGC